MEWINVNDKHFVDIIEGENGSNLAQNNNCPNKPFLAGLFIVSDKKQKPIFIYLMVVIFQNEIMEYTEKGIKPLGLFKITDVEYWCNIDEPNKI